MATAFPVGVVHASEERVMKSYLKIGSVGNLKLSCSVGAQDRLEAAVATLRLKPGLRLEHLLKFVGVDDRNL